MAIQRTLTTVPARKPSRQQATLAIPFGALLHFVWRLSLALLLVGGLWWAIFKLTGLVLAIWLITA